MYYVVYGFFYLVSLLPFRLIYVLSDIIFVVLYYGTGYRRKQVLDNLQKSFPEKSNEELIKISKQFYHNFVDTWLEMIKILSMSQKTAHKRITHDYKIVEELYATGRSVQVYGGHFMNWEYIPVSLPPNQPYTTLVVYMPLSNAILERLLLHIRGKFGLIMLKAGHMKKEMAVWQDKQYMMVLGADQSPGEAIKAAWLWFMNRPTGFVKSPWKQACQLNHPSIYYTITRKKRGHYHFATELFELNPKNFTEADLARRYAKRLEEEIREKPADYLWTHRRWKLPWKPEYKELWVDDKPMPA